MIIQFGLICFRIFQLCYVISVPSVMQYFEISTNVYVIRVSLTSITRFPELDCVIVNCVIVNEKEIPQTLLGLFKKLMIQLSITH